MKDNKFLKEVFNELDVICKKLEIFVSCDDMELNECENLFLELIDKRSWEISGITGEIERRAQKKPRY